MGASIALWHPRCHAELVKSPQIQAFSPRKSVFGAQKFMRAAKFFAVV